MTIGVTGRIYNQELLAGEAGRLGIILDTPPNKTFLTAPFYVRSDGDYGLDGVLDDLPRALTQLGSRWEHPDQAAELHAVRHGQRAQVHARADELLACTSRPARRSATTTRRRSRTGPPPPIRRPNCDKLPFKPIFSISVGSKGTNGERAHPPLDVHVSQGAGEAGILANAVTLPFELGPNLAAFDIVCTAAQLAADACPAGSQVGTTTATSSFVATPLSGPVYPRAAAG